MLFAFMPVYKANAEIQLKIKLDQRNNIKSTIFGFNTNLAPGHYGFLDKTFDTNIDDIRPAMLRFPGGTVANFYHWKEEGFLINDLTRTTDKKLNASNIEKYNSLKRLRNGRLSFDDFMVLCKKFNIEPVVVVNLYTGTPGESAAWVRYAKEHDYRVKKWELGNELYIRIYKNVISGPEKYLSIAREHARAMKKEDPEIEVAVPVTGSGFTDYSGSKGEYRKNWDRVMATADFVDAYAVHAYWKLPDTDDIETIYENLFINKEKDWKSAISYYDLLYANKPLWLTEWNINGFENRVINNTHLNALFIGDTIINIINSKKIEIAGYHQLAARGEWPSLFSAERNVSSNHSHESIMRTSYYPFKLFSETIKDAESVYHTEISENINLSVDNKKDNKLSAISAAAILGEDRSWRILLINKAKNKQNVVIWIDDEMLRGDSKLTCLTSSNLRDAIYDYSSTVPKNTPYSVQLDTSVNGGKVELPGYSFCSIRNHSRYGT